MPGFVVSRLSQYLTRPLTCLVRDNAGRVVAFRFAAGGHPELAGGVIAGQAGDLSLRAGGRRGDFVTFGLELLLGTEAEVREAEQASRHPLTRGTAAVIRAAWHSVSRVIFRCPGGRKRRVWNGTCFVRVIFRCPVVKGTRCRGELEWLSWTSQT